MKVVCLLIKKSIENKLKYSLYKNFSHLLVNAQGKLPANAGIVIQIKQKHLSIITGLICLSQD